MIWGKKTINGIVYDLSHLDPFIVDVSSKDGAQVYRVRIVFGAHTFARELLGTDTPDFHVLDGTSIRCFCPLRHGYSIHLPDMVRAASNGMVYFGNKDDRYLLIDNLPGVNAPYIAPFKIDKPDTANVQATMFVVSAHPRPNHPSMPRVRLSKLIELSIAGKKVVRPKK